MRGRRVWLVGLALLAASASAHDIWIEVAPQGAHFELSLVLGNHGNEHRDFKRAGSIPPEGKSLVVWGPDGKRDLSPRLTRKGDDWGVDFGPPAAGVYEATSFYDRVASYGPVRDVKSAKAFFGQGRAKDRVLGHPLEIVALDDALAAQAGKPFRVKVLYRGKPLLNSVVAFVPKGAEAIGEFDSRYQARTGTDGTATIALPSGGPTLVSVHVVDENSHGKGYESVRYSATLWLAVRG